jgi:hypothetical protein
VQFGTQSPLMQLVEPFGFVHTLPQPLQWSRSVSVFVSQPSRGSPLQSAKPALHTGTQTPDWQLVEPCALLQAIPQAPQS